MSATSEADISASGVVDPVDAAQSAGLTHLTDEAPGIRRRKSGKGFTYRDPQGRTITDPEEIRRLTALAVPPAYTDVWISPDPNGAHPGDGARCARPQAVSLPPRVPEGPAGTSTKFGTFVASAEFLPVHASGVDADMRQAHARAR